MKLLFDKNLSPKLPNRLKDVFPHSLHVRDIGMKATIDSREFPPIHPGEVLLEDFLKPMNLSQYFVARSLLSATPSHQ